MLIRLLAGLILALGLSGPVSAQTSDPSFIDMEVSVGLQGWVDHNAPVPVAVTVRSDVLFSGILQLQSGRSTVEVGAEVPAGGEKTYELVVSPTMTAGLITFRLVPAGQDDAVATVRVQPKQSSDSVMVGTLEADGLVLPARTAIGEVPIVEVPLANLAVDLGPLDYLVLGASVVLTEDVLGWISQGGYLVVDSGSLDELNLGSGEEIAGSGITRFESGDGLILAADDLRDPDAPWTRSIQPIGTNFRVLDPWSQSEVQLLRAASSDVPTVFASPALLVGLAVYSIVVAPVNLLVLKRTNRRELAWITVPALGVVTVLAVVLIGALSPQSTQFAHATVLIGSRDGPELHSVVVAATTGERVHHLAVGGGRILYPAATGDALGLGLIAADRTVTSSNELSLEFREAGYGTAGVVGQAPNLPTLSVTDVEGSPTLTVENTSSFVLTAYGVVTGPVASAAPGELTPGSTGTVVVEGGEFGTASDAVAQARPGQNTSRWWQVYRPLTNAAQHHAGDQFFFGFVDDLPLSVEIDGRSQEIDGPGIIVIPLTDYDLDLGRATPQVVAASADGGVQGEAPWQWVDGEWAIVRFEVPTDRTLQLVENEDMFGGAVTPLEAWDWLSGSFVGVETGEVNGERFVDGNGQMLVRIVPQAENEFGGVQFYPASLNVTWNPGPG